MPKSFPHKGLLAVGGGALSDAVLRHCNLKGDPVAEAKARERRARDIISVQPELAVWIGARLYVRDNKNVLNAFAEALGLNLSAAVKPPGARAPGRPPSAAVKPSRAKRAAAPSSQAAIAS
jgi:hypothetical protein